MKQHIKKLPQKVYDYVDRNATLNTFGLINLSVLKVNTGTRLSKPELIKRINNQFSKQMVNNKIEFIGLK